MEITAVRSALAWVILAAAGILAGYGVYLASMFAAIPFLLFTALGAAPFIALAVVAALYLWTRRRPCRAPMWMQHRRRAFWAGAATALVICCAYTIIEMPQTIPFVYAIVD